jgi:hypothetical protein
MEDALIVDLYWARDEQALAETAAKFGTYCRKIADNILHSAHDAEECENDTWLAAWNSMPANRPARLAPYLGRITRNLARRAAWRTVLTPPKLDGSSAIFCALCPKKHAIYFCVAIGIATPRQILPRGTV